MNFLACFFVFKESALKGLISHSNKRLLSKGERLEDIVLSNGDTYGVEVNT